MSDDALRHRLQQIQGDEPDERFVDALRDRLLDEPEPAAGPILVPGPEPDQPATVIELGGRRQQPVDPTEPTGPRWSRAAWPLTAAAVLLFGGLVLAGVGGGGNDAAPLETASERQEVGESWVRSIVDGDRDAFVAVHHPDVTANDTLMAYSRDGGVLTPDRVAEFYFAGFDAFVISVEIDGDIVRSEGCTDTDRDDTDDTVRCGYTTSLIGSARHTYTVFAELTVEDGLITAVEFDEPTTDPPDLRDDVERFFADEATDDDRACMALGFNTPGCGEQDSDFLRRYIDYHEARKATDG